jgi:integrase
MATIKAFIKPTKGKALTKVRFYISRGRGSNMLYWTSGLDINPEHWDSKKEQYKAKVLVNAIERADFNRTVNVLKDVLLTAYNLTEDKDKLTSKLFEVEVDKQLNPEKYNLVEKVKTFFDYFDEFLSKHKVAEVRKNNYKVVKRALQRYEAINKIKNKSFEFSFNTLSPDLLRELEEFLKSEHESYEKHKDIYKLFPESRKPEPRGRNTISGIFTKIRTFVLWAISEDLLTNDPFDKFVIDECLYGTPYFLTIQERNTIAELDLTSKSQLAIQRDIFIFQCWSGCRIGDLYSLKKTSIINNVVEYIQKKTKGENPQTIKVPLSNQAKDIVERYSNIEGNRLFPFISMQKYNKAIKAIFTEAKLNRSITVINPTTSEEEKRPLDEIASSHLARRTFIGNLYRMTKDQKAVSSLSGHAPNSKAFGRYADVDNEMKIDILKLIE